MLTQDSASSPNDSSQIPVNMIIENLGFLVVAVVAAAAGGVRVSSERLTGLLHTSRAALHSQVQAL